MTCTHLSPKFPLFYYSVFVEGKRSRTGKQLSPRSGFLRICLEPLRDGRIDSLTFLPVSIDYERRVDENALATEILGKKKQKESLWGLANAAASMAVESAIGGLVLLMSFPSVI